jgi:hypothetical protein
VRERKSNIMLGSEYYARLGRVPRTVSDDHLRELLHAYNNILMGLVHHIDTLYDEADFLHSRVNSRRDEFDGLKDKLLLAPDGELALLEKRVNGNIDRKTGRMTSVYLAMLGGVATAAIFFGLAAAQGHA